MNLNAPQDVHYDVIIIGSGAGGGTLAQRLAPSGKRILIIERGDFLPRERENWDTKAVFEQKRYLAKETWFDKDDKPFEPYTHYWVGGNTKVYGAALLRMREHDFGEVRHWGGVSPAWPITYDDLEPYYSEAEHLYSVHGTRAPGKRDPYDPKSSRDYPFGPIAPEPRIGELMCDLKALGTNPFPVPLGIRLNERDRAAPPSHLSQFDGYPDLTEAKADAHVVGIRAALKYPNVSVLTRAKVDRLESDPSGRQIREVLVTRDGQQMTLRADVIVLAAGAINSAAILLRSSSDTHPNGLANSSDQVGRNYMTHHNGCFLVVSSEPNPSQFQKHFAITDFYRGSADSPFPLGTIQLMGKPDPGTIEWLRGDQLPGEGIESIQNRTIDFFLTVEDLPSPGNRITLRPDGSLRVSYTPNNLEAYQRLETKLRELMTLAERGRGRSQPNFFASRLGVSGVSHQNGTLRFGIDPRTSVLDINCKAHDVDNLYVVDGSFFPSSSAVNPSLTIMANALRVGDHLIRRLGAINSVQREVAQA
ncbi:MAG: GMC family oxidoreductase [Phycisphaeraceae bacterium]|nr:GMC family oxidoreductase [Phycisphaeraceae bacterium]